MKKRILIIALCLALCLPGAWVVAKVMRLVRLTDGDFVYIILDDGTAEIRQYTGRDTSLEIPAKMKDRPVTRIGDKSFEWRFWLKEVSIPDGVTEIGTGAFHGCHGLKTISMPDSVTAIGSRAFAECSSLQDIDLPENVVSLGKEAFAQCVGLTSVSLPSGITLTGSNPFAGCPELRTVTIAPGHPYLATDGHILYDTQTQRLICFLQAEGPGEYTVPANIKTIGEASCILKMTGM